MLCFSSPLLSSLYVLLSPFSLKISLSMLCLLAVLLHFLVVCVLFACVCFSPSPSPLPPSCIYLYLVCVWVHAHIYVYRDQRETVGAISQVYSSCLMWRCVLLFCVKWGLSLIWNTSISMGCRDPLVSIPSALGLKVHAIMPGVLSVLGVELGSP